MPDVLTMKVEFSLMGGKVEVRTDGDLMGRYDDFDQAGRDLGDEFKYRMEQSNA